MRYLYCCLLLLLSFLLAQPALAGKKKALQPVTIAPRTAGEALVPARAIRPVAIRSINKVANYQLRQVRSFDALGSWAETAPDALQYQEGLQDGSVTQPVREAIAKAKALTRFVRENQRYIDLLGPQSIFELPAAINTSIGGLDYTIVFDEARMMPEWAEIDVYMVFTLPQNEQTLTFMARAIKFSKDGGLIGDLRLELLGDHTIGLNGDKSIMTLRGINDLSAFGIEEMQATNFVVFDCNGFVEMGLDAQITISRDLLLPEIDGKVVEDETARVNGRFQTVLSDWNDLIVEIDLPRFQVRGLKGVGFDVQGAVFDFSDLRNAPGLTFPASYESPQFIGEERAAWRGIYISQAQIALPKEFAKRDSDSRVTFSGYDLIFDERGFSGTIAAQNILDIETGAMDKWSFSVEDLLVELDAGTLVGAGFGGKVQTSIADQPFDYTAMIREGNEYLFTIAPPEKMSFPLWGAGQVDIYEGSYLEVGVSDGKFLPRAYLNGTLNIIKEQDAIALPEIHFQGLTVQTVKPYISAEFFSLGASQERKKMIANFPVQIQDVALIQGESEEEVGIAFKVLLNLMKSEGEGSKGFAAEAGLIVYGKLDEEERMHEFAYKRLAFTRASIDVDLGKFALRGYVEFFRNHETYGKGFQGNLMVRLPMGIEVEANALFGNTPEYRYWYVDFMVERNKPGLSTPGIGITGIGGGLFRHMRQGAFDPNPNNAIGKTRSGIVYYPDNSISLGIKAMVTFETRPTKAAFNGEAQLEVAFSSSGGLDNISISGVGNFMKAPGLDKLAKLQEKVGGLLEEAATVADKFSAGVDAQAIEAAQEMIAAERGENPMVAAVKILFDIRNATLHGNLQVYVNVGRAMTGVGPYGLAGEAVVHFSPTEWYIHIGRPDQRVGLQFLGIARTGSYLMIGDNLPGSPAPDENVEDILPGQLDLDYMRNENALGSGSGFAFGSSFSLDTGPLKFLVFYARFMAGAGFDIMLKNYGDDVRCEGREGPIGVNGWYANGQAYAYFAGDIGIEVNLFFVKGKFRILTIGAAAILQAKLPNPFWMRGYVGGYFSILNGLVSGKCKFRVIIGEECDMVGEGSVVQGIDVIAELTPKDTEADVSVFTKPQAVFNMPVNTSFRLEDLDGKIKTYRVHLDHFKVKLGADEIAGNLEWNAEKEVVAFDALDLLPGERKLVAEVQVSFQYNENGWQPVKVKGKPLTETKTITFTTGVMPDRIPEENVAYSYPVNRMYNFYPDEYGQGYLQLINGQDDLFQLGEEWEQVIRFSTATGSDLETALSYDNSKNILSFTFPEGLQTNTIYQWSVVNKPRNQGPAIDANVADVSETLEQGEEGNEITLVTKEAAGNLEILEEKTLYKAYFRSSNYRTLNDKLDQIKTTTSFYRNISGGVGRLGLNLEGVEFFDRHETAGINGGDRGIQITAQTGNAWLDDFVNPVVYDNKRKTIMWRDREIYGVPPYLAVFLQNAKNDQVLTDAEISSNAPTGINVRRAEMRYDLEPFVYRDFKELQSKAAGVPSNLRSTWQNKIATTNYSSIGTGVYKVTLRYVLPGTNTVTTQRDYTFRHD